MPSKQDSISLSITPITAHYRVTISITKIRPNLAGFLFRPRRSGASKCLGAIRVLACLVPAQKALKRSIGFLEKQQREGGLRPLTEHVPRAYGRLIGASLDRWNTLNGAGA